MKYILSPFVPSTLNREFNPTRHVLGVLLLPRLTTDFYVISINPRSIGSLYAMFHPQIESLAPRHVVVVAESSRSGATKKDLDFNDFKAENLFLDT